MTVHIGEQKLKEGDEVVRTIETKNNAQLLFFTDAHQVYKCRVGDFADGKASVMGEYVPARLGMDAGERPVYMALTEDYAGHMLFLFENGKCAKVPMQSYATKQNRKKLLNAYSDKAKLVWAACLPEETELAITTSAGQTQKRLPAAAAFSSYFLNMRFSSAIARLSTLITIKMPHMPSSITFND